VRVVSVLLAVLAAAVAVVGANVVLLGYGSERSDRVGKLSPVAHVQAPAQKPPLTQPEDARRGGTDLDD
jgi:hypothetical protein